MEDTVPEGNILNAAVEESASEDGAVADVEGAALAGSAAAFVRDDGLAVPVDCSGSRYRIQRGDDQMPLIDERCGRRGIGEIAPACGSKREDVVTLERKVKFVAGLRPARHIEELACLGRQLSQVDPGHDGCGRRDSPGLRGQEGGGAAGQLCEQ